ncbi:hypothetical protein JCM16303_005348 [Sporobolomyces ruberrimus]
MPLPPNLFAGSKPSAMRPQAAFDDWESAYDQEDEPRRNVDQNVRLWQEANAAKSPSYTILPSSSSSSSARSSPLPPTAALDPSTTNGPPKLMILKRPTSNNASTANGRSSSQDGSARERGEKSLKEREKEYAEARRRIYGDAAGTGDTVTEKNGKPTPSRNQSSARKDASQVSNGGRPSPRNSSRPPSTANSRASTPSSSGPSGTASVIRKPKGPSGEGKGFGANGRNGTKGKGA